MDEDGFLLPIAGVPNVVGNFWTWSSTASSASSILVGTSGLGMQQMLRYAAEESKMFSPEVNPLTAIT